MDEQPTIDDIWVNRLASRLGVAMAQNERLQLEVEMLQQRVKELEGEKEDPTADMNGESYGVLT